MKRLPITILFAVAFLFADAQYKNIDSLKRLLAASKADTTTIILKTDLAYAYLYYKPDSALLLAKSGLFMARNISYAKGESKCYKEMGDAYEQMGNYPAAMDAYLKHLHLAQEQKMPIEITHALINIGLLYEDQDEFRQAVNYTIQAKNEIEAISNKKSVKNYDLNRVVILLNAGFYYYKLNILDSALLYEQNAYQLSVRIHNNDYLGSILQNLGLIQGKNKNNKLAIAYYRMSAKSSMDGAYYSTLTSSYLLMADFYRSVKLTDSSTFYAQKALDVAKKATYTKGVMDASTLLADNYSLTDKAKAYDYLKMAIAERDTLFNTEKVKQLQNLKFAEQLREQDIAELKKQQEEERKDNLQLSAIALFIPLFFMVLLLLSKTRVHHRIIEFMSILSILFLFEFLTLLTHPLISKFTQNSPIYDFFIFVCMAAVLAPMHHRFNHWLIRRLTNLQKWGKHVEENVKNIIESAEKS